MSSAIFDFFHTDEELSRQLYGPDKVIHIDYIKLYTFDPEYAIKFLKTPIEEMRYLTDYAKATSEVDKEIYIENIPITHRIHDLNDSLMKTLIQVEGVVVQRTKPLMRATEITFNCRNCDYHTKVRQTTQFREYPKDKCPLCEGSRWIQDYKHSDFINYQEIHIQELIENTPNGSSPDRVKVVLTGSLIRSCEPGESVKVVGILEAYDQSKRSADIELEYHVNAVSLINNTDADTINLTDTDLDEIQELMKQPEHLQRVIKSIAPTIYGVSQVKEAVAYQQCEGQTKHINRTRRRGQLHILLAGPPGCGKSEIGDFMVMCNPKGRKAVGRGSSAVGLTASVVKDGDRFVLRAGAMALADNGFLFVDEIEKMSQTDSGAMHPAMEQQEIRIDKADISATLKTRCSILAACNPIGGVWDEYKSIVGNLYEKGRGIAIPLLDRFALIFVMKQNMESEKEQEVIDHIMLTNEEEDLTPPYAVDELRKIFAYARTIKVKLSKDVGERLKEFYMQLYEVSKRDNIIIVSRRQIQDLIRISEASARLHGRRETTLEDAEAAIRIVATSLKDYGVDPETGKVDQVKALYGPTKTIGGRVQELPGVIQRLCARNVDTSQTNRKELIDYLCKLWDMEPQEAGKILDILLKDGTAFCPTPYTVALT